MMKLISAVIVEKDVVESRETKYPERVVNSILGKLDTA